MRLAIASKPYNCFTRPLPISTMKSIAMEKNAHPLPKIEEPAGVHAGFARLNSMLPQNDYCLINPNIQVYSEEIQKSLEEK